MVKKVSKSSFYYAPVKPFSTVQDIGVLDAINNIYSDFPSYEARRMTKQLQKDGHNVGRKFVKKAIKYMGIEALYTKPKTTTANKEHTSILQKYGIKISMDGVGRATDNNLDAKGVKSLPLIS